MYHIILINIGMTLKGIKTEGVYQEATRSRLFIFRVWSQAKDGTHGSDGSVSVIIFKSSVYSCPPDIPSSLV